MTLLSGGSRIFENGWNTMYQTVVFIANAHNEQYAFYTEKST